MRALRALRSLSAQRRSLLFRSMLVVGLVRLALWSLPSRTIIRGVRALLRRRAATTTSRDVESILWAVRTASRRIPAATCLTQALAAHWMLRRAGMASTLCVGVRRGRRGEFLAHAWLESEHHIILGERGATEFTRLPDLGAQGTQAAPGMRA